jgi:hypothetical protein
MSSHQAPVLSALEIGHGVKGDALQISDDEALATALGICLDEEHVARQAQHSASYAVTTAQPRYTMRAIQAF